MLPDLPFMCAADGIPKAVQCSAQAPRHAQWHTRGAHYRHPAPLGAPGGAFWSFICWYPARSPNITQSRTGFCLQSPLMSTARMALPNQAGLYSLNNLCKPF